MDNCFNNSIDSNCTDTFALNRPHPLFRNQFPSSEPDRNIKACQKSTPYLYLAEICGNICLEDCYQAYYLTTLGDKMKTGYTGVPTENQIITLQILANSNPNIMIEHFAEMTFISLICNFGGLIGMYLGVSLQSVIGQAWTITKNHFIKINNTINVQPSIIMNRPNVILNNLID